MREDRLNAGSVNLPFGRDGNDALSARELDDAVAEAIAKEPGGKGEPEGGSEEVRP